MTQLAKIIDVTRSYVPVDPQAFPETMHGTGREDTPEERIPVVPYEGYNFMPTSYGYRSYFGTNSHLNVDALTSRVDHVLMLQNNQFKNILIALCEDGIWIKESSTTGAWTHAISLTVPAEGTHYDWTYCLIEDTLYTYRQGGTVYYKFSSQIVYWDIPANITGFSTLATPGVSGGTLVAGTYNYQVAYFDSNGVLSNPTTASAATLTATGGIYLRWDPVVGATAYRVYRTVAGVTKYFDTAYNNYLDKSLSGTTIALPDTTAPRVQGYTYTPAPVTPTFLNMTGQIGIFKAGGRLGFWDSENSIAWSSLDDLADFTPSLETLANAMIFTDVTGRIINIKQHGQGFIVYATQSIVYIQQKVDATFQWDPVVLLNTSGIAYMEECVMAAPDTLHFAWTNTGLYKIDKGRLELIVPEVTDFLREAEDPIYLQVLEGRYLAIQLLDERYLMGNVNFTVSNVPEMTYTWQGSDLLAEVFEGTVLTGEKVCGFAGQYDNGLFLEMQADGATSHAAAGSPPKAPNTTYKPRYTCYLSVHDIDPTNITWGASPCATVDPNGVEKNMCPTGNQGKLGKPFITVPDSSMPGGQWTMERFFQIQNALWDREEQYRAAFINAILARTGFGTKTEKSATCTPSGPTRSECTIGTYIKDYMGRIFGFNKCTFWLTRYINSVSDITRVKYNKVECVPVSGGGGSPVWTSSLPTHANADCVFGDYTNGMPWIEGNLEPEAVAAAMYAGAVANAARCNRSIEPMTGWNCDTPSISGRIVGFGTIQPNIGSDMCSYRFFTSGATTATCPVGTHPVVVGSQNQCFGSYKSASYQVFCEPDITMDAVSTMNAYNSEKVRKVSLTPEQPYCKLVGWTYTDINGVERTIPASGSSCLSPDTPPPKPPAPNSWNSKPAPSVLGQATGTFCSKPFSPITIPEVSANPINWPSQSLTMPASSFLLQDGSIAPIYPTFAGALVYDLHLKKWGKLKLNYKRLLDYSPINNASGDIIPSETFGLYSGTLLDDGLIYLFDQYPDDSYITYGKIGYYRLGMTTMEEARVHFRTPSTGTFELTSSLDGRNLEAMFGVTQVFNNETKCELLGATSARWHNLTIRGYYDIQYMEFRGVVSGRR